MWCFTTKIPFQPKFSTYLVKKIAMSKCEFSCVRILFANEIYLVKCSHQGNKETDAWIFIVNNFDFGFVKVYGWQLIYLKQSRPNILKSGKRCASKRWKNCIYSLNKTRWRQFPLIQFLKFPKYVQNWNFSQLRDFFCKKGKNTRNVPSISLLSNREISAM